MIRIGSHTVDPNPSWSAVMAAENAATYYDKVCKLIGDYPISEDAAKSVYSAIVYEVEQKKVVGIDGLCKPALPVQATYGQYCDVSVLLKGEPDDLIKVCAVYCQHGYSESVLERLLDLLPHKPFAQVVGTGEWLIDNLNKLNELRDRQLDVPTDSKAAQAYEGAYKGADGNRDVGLIVYSRLLQLANNDISKVDTIRMQPYADVYQAEKAAAEKQRIEYKMSK